MSPNNKNIINFIREVYNQPSGPISLHEPCFSGSEKKYLEDCIDSTFVSSVGKYINLFEEKIQNYTGIKHAIATVNGTAALHMALLLSGVKRNDEVITQSLTFIATANAIRYCEASPVFIDVDSDTLGLSPEKLNDFLEKEAVMNSNGFCYNKKTGKKISACVPMHTFGHPARIDEIKVVCDKYNIKLVEDAAESIGSKYKGKHTGGYGLLGVLSFNGNKTITTGGGGMILTNNDEIAVKAKHLTTTAKVKHPYEFIHDETGYNYRLPNINAALGCAQMESLDFFISEKRKLADKYKNFFMKEGVNFFSEPDNSFSNYWLNSIILSSKNERDEFLEFSKKNDINSRPV
ncbi:LegC family aminotransferase, partial [Bacteroidota bacterium]